MRRKREGASLIYVIITFMFVCMVSVPMLSMVSANYIGRVVENKRIENLYGSDSGINVAYNIIVKTFDAASMYGYYSRKDLLENNNSNSSYKNEIESLKDEIERLENEILDLNKSDLPDKNNDIAEKKAQIQQNNEKLELILNEEFKRAFVDFITKEERLKNCLKSGTYISSVTGVDEDNFTTVRIEYPNSQPDLSKSEVKLRPPSTDKDSKMNGDIFDIFIISSFKSNVNEVIGINERTVQANYTLTVPNYDDVFFSTSLGNENKYLALQDRALTVGGNMSIDSVESLKIKNGDVFVNGIEPNDISNNIKRTYEKYNGGITINNSNDVIFEKDIITRNTFNIQNNSNVTVNNNLYARNAYIGLIDSGDEGFAENSQISVNNVSLDNDLTIKATKSEFNMKNFYGINDKNIYYEDNNIKKNKVVGDLVKSSSSIIINGKKDSHYSTVNINESAYIMGTAHINTENGYQTGESGAVKGNYIAYSVPINDLEKFEYDKPLNLLEEENVFKKAQHFKTYWENISQNDEADAGGIKWPDSENIYSVGAIVYKEPDNEIKIIEPNYDPTIESPIGEIYKKRVDFASKVYKFGEDATIDDYKNVNKLDIEALIDFNSIDGVSANEKDEKAIFVNDDKSKIQIKSNKIIVYDKDDNKREFEFNSSNGINAVIVTNGDVIINDNVIFNGTIICNGNLDIKNNSDVNINYNSEVVDRIQNNNEKLFNDVFGGFIINDNSTDKITEDNNEILNINYDISKFLKKGIWKIKG